MSDHIAAMLHLELALQATTSTQLARSIPHLANAELDQLPRLLTHTDFRSIYSPKLCVEATLALVQTVTTFESLQVLARDRRKSVRAAVLNRDDLTAEQLLTLDLRGDDHWHQYAKHTRRLLTDDAITLAQLHALTERSPLIWREVAHFLADHWNTERRDELLQALFAHVEQSQAAILLVRLADKPDLPADIWRYAMQHDYNARRLGARNRHMPLAELSQIRAASGYFDAPFAACVIQFLDRSGQRYSLGDLDAHLRRLRPPITVGEVVEQFLAGSAVAGATTGAELFSLESL